MTFWDPIEQEWNSILRRIPHPTAPHQPMPAATCEQRQISEARDDFTREAEATGA